MAESKPFIATGNAQPGTEAFAIMVVEKFRIQITAHCQRMLGNLDDAKDTVMDTWSRIRRSRATFRGVTEKELLAWVLTIATRACLDKIRSRRPEEPLDKHSSISEPGEGVDVGVIFKLEVERILEEMPEIYRQVFVLYFLEQLSYEDISTAMGIPITTIKSRLHRARMLFQKSYLADDLP